MAGSEWPVMITAERLCMGASLGRASVRGHDKDVCLFFLDVAEARRLCRSRNSASRSARCNGRPINFMTALVWQRLRWNSLLGSSHPSASRTFKVRQGPQRDPLRNVVGYL